MNPATDHRASWPRTLGLVWMLLGIVMLPLVMFVSMFLFDAPGSDENLYLNVHFYALVATPFCFLLGGYESWSREKWWPLAFGPLGALVAVASMVAIEIFCGGNFVCR